MRTAIIAFLLIISICHRIGLSQQQTANFERHNPKQSHTANKNRVKSFGNSGQEEYYIPSSSNSQQQKPQQFIYPNNFENAYQFSQYKYSNRVPSTIGQKLWASPLYSNYKLKSRTDERSISDQSNEYGSDDRIRSSQYRQSDGLENSDSRVFNSNLKASINSDRVRDFNSEQQNLAQVNTNTNTNEDDYERSRADETRHTLLGPAMRRKALTNIDNAVKSSALHLDEQNSVPLALARQQQTVDSDGGHAATLSDVYFVAIVACISAVAIFSVIAAGYCFYRVQQSNKAAADVDYPAYGVVGPASKETNTNGNISPSGDRKLAQSAQMYHYHHQKQQMIASEKAVTPRHTSASDVESDEENEEGEYTVYECPGLAPTGEMEVKNPLFHDDITPVSSPPVNGNTKDK